MARKRPTPLTIKPSQGGRLMTDVSAEEVGPFDYTLKRNWRRDLEIEARREGHDYFWPNRSGDFSADPGDQPFPNNVTLTTIDSLTRSGTTARANVTGGHIFVEGETVLISGADQVDYNGTFTISNVTQTTFDFTVENSPTTPATGTPTVKSAMPINLFDIIRRPNGKVAVIAGTAARLFRFFALDDGAYFEGTGADAYFSETGPDTPYFVTDPGEWLIIGNGYSVDAQRWEMVAINGWAIFNNGIDLPQSYRVEDVEVTPLYELREQGIARVGTIADFNSILFAGDVSEIIEEKLPRLFEPHGTIHSNNLLASQSSTTVTVPVDFFTSDHNNQFIIFEDDDETTVQITSITGPREVEVTPSATVENKPFKMRIKASQAGSYYSNSITASVDHTTMVVSAPTGTHVPSIGDLVRFTNGFSSLVSAVVDATNFTLTLADDPGEDIIALPYYVVSSSTDYTLVADAPLFDFEMVGRNILFDDGTIRRIETVVSTTEVTVDIDLAITSKFVGVEKPETYGRYEDTAYLDRIQYRVLWSMHDLPTRFASSAPCSIEAGSRTLVLDYPVKSFESGQEVLVLGAGVDGGNLTATILLVSGFIIILDTPAETTITGTDLARSDTIGSIAGFADLQDDSSAVIQMRKLRDRLVIYKDTAIIIAAYLGDPNIPFDFQRPIPLRDGTGVYYRNTLIAAGANQHVYAGRNSFYSFDLTSQEPQIVQALELSKSLFFDNATLAETTQIFAATCTVTHEILFCFPGATTDKTILFDTRHGTLATMDVEFTAASTIKRPETGISVGETQDWFVGAIDQVVVLYGKLDAPYSGFSNADSIFYRRSAEPFTAVLSDYDSILRGGLNGFGNDFDEKHVIGYAVQLASQSPVATITAAFSSTVNPSRAVTLLATQSFPAADLESFVPMDFIGIYFQDKLTVSGASACKLSRRIWQYVPLDTRSMSRSV